MSNSGSTAAGPDDAHWGVQTTAEGSPTPQGVTVPMPRQTHVGGGAKPAKGGRRRRATGTANPAITTPVPPSPQPGVDQPPDSQPDPKELTLPAGVEPPTMGMPRFWMWWNIRFNRQDPNNPGYLLVPAPNAKEVAYRQERDFLGAVQSAKTDLVVQYRTRHTAIILVVNSKGGGSKTTTTNWSATGMRIETGCEVTVMDSNWASGNAAQRLRFRKDETIYDRMVVDNFGLLSRDHNTYVGQVKANTDGVRCIAAKRVQKGGSGKLNAGEYGGLAKLAFANCEYLWIDTPNDITSDQFLMLAQMATVIVFTANVAEPDSLRQLGESMQVLRDFGLEDKVNRSVVVINNLPPGKTANDYRKYQHEVDIHNNDEVTTEFPGHKGPWMGIRHDPAMADARQVDWSALRRETAQDIRLLNIAVLKCVPLKPVLKELPKSQGTPAQPTAPPTSVPPERSAVVTPPSGDATPGPVQRPTQRFATILSEFTDPTTGADGHTETA